MPISNYKPEAFTHQGRLYFTEQELKCRGSGGLILMSGFAEALLALRLAYGKPMIIRSCCRSTEHNRKEGGAPSSYHIYDTGRGCCALDVATKTSAERAALAKLALNNGWSVGVSRTFLHLDLRTRLGKDQIIFLYGRG